ncbi:MAG TPA: tail fiber protein [Alphaproteobacteria bacterium]|nr:tail fiber protein [Alphaproteobacteria bacterium]
MSTPFLGQISLFAGIFAPRNWALCSGQLLNINQSTALFSLLGTNFGGDGRVTFGLPDFRGRIPIGQGTGPGLTIRLMGQTVGTETVTLNSTQMPMHPHTLNAANTPANSTNVTGTALPGTLSSPDNFYTVNDGTTPAPSGVTLNPLACGLDGGNQAHNNMMPTVTVSYIIALQGIFPTRN